MEIRISKKIETGIEVTPYFLGGEFKINNDIVISFEEITRETLKETLGHYIDNLHKIKEEGSFSEIRVLLDKVSEMRRFLIFLDLYIHNHLEKAMIDNMVDFHENISWEHFCRSLKNVPRSETIIPEIIEIPDIDKRSIEGLEHYSEVIGDSEIDISELPYRIQRYLQLYYFQYIKRKFPDTLEEMSKEVTPAGIFKVVGFGRKALNDLTKFFNKRGISWNGRNI